MKIALLPSAFAPAVGGVEVLTARLAHRLAGNGHGIEVWTSRSDGDALRTEEDIEGIHVRRFVFALPRADPRSLMGLPIAVTSTMRQLWSAAARFAPDVLHVQCFSGNGSYATALSRLSGIPLVVTLQGETVMDDHDIYDRSASLRTSLRLGLRRAAVVTGCSAFVLKDAQNRFGLDMEKAQVIFNGVDIEPIPSVPVDVPFDRYVLGLGRLVRKKGFDLLLEAFSEIAGSHLEVGLVIAGDGGELDFLRRSVLALGLEDRVHFTGTLARGAVGSVMRDAEVFVMPSRVEPFGIVILEAWRAGIPVVATLHGGPPEFIEHNVSGLVVDPFEVSGLASAIDRLLRSPKLRKRLSGFGRGELDRFSWAEVAGRYESVYDAAALSK